MAYVNVGTREWNAKIVYWGPGLCGKSANLKWLHDHSPHEQRGKLMRLATETEQPASFEFLPLSLGDLHGVRTRFYVYTTPGHIHLDKSRQSILADADGVVFVADSHPQRAAANAEAMQELRERLCNRQGHDAVATAIQCNKRDLSYAASIAEVCAGIDVDARHVHAAAATHGSGVWDTFYHVARAVMVSHGLQAQAVFPS